MNDIDGAQYQWCPLYGALKIICILTTKYGWLCPFCKKLALTFTKFEKKTHTLRTSL
jgi:hypothetical protein